jgi:acyl carrier protein
MIRQPGEMNKPSFMESIEAFYPLSPVQESMLVHTLDAHGAAGGVEQSHWTLLADLDAGAFERAWQRLIDRHAILRSGFVWQGVSKPIQVVLRQAGFSLLKEDWRGLSFQAQQERLGTFLEADRARGFDLAAPPLMRLALMQVAANQFEFVWTRHHLLLDGWSGSLLADELLNLYEAFRSGGDLGVEARRPYRDYVAWLRKQDMAAAENFWRNTLSGFAEPTPVSLACESPVAAAPAGEHAEQQITLPTQTAAALRALSRRCQVTLNTIAQAAWALLLSHYGGEEDVVFGAAVSGRAVELAGIEAALGPLANILPVRVKVAPGADLASWLGQLQAQQSEQRQYEYVSLAQVQQWGEVAQEQRLFATVLFFASQPLTAGLSGQQSGLEAHQLAYSVRTGYPITVTVIPGAQWRIGLAYDARQFEHEAMTRALNQFQTLLELMAKDPARPLGDVVRLIRPERLQALDDQPETRSRHPRDQRPAGHDPTYTVVSAFVFLDHRRRHAASGAPRPEMAQAFTPPRNRFEEAVASVWAEAFGMSQVGIHDNFFELGGHSLVATQVTSRLSEHFQVQVPLRTLFENPEVAQLAEVVARLQDQAEPEDEQLLDMLEQLSDEEVQALLKQKAGGGETPAGVPASPDKSQSMP